ncbi:hypothetical protein BLOT_001707 [Blomia tropicalis]|nr:hypothetical protein BLOT_001707 [Blomia tropicalis]
MSNKYQMAFVFAILFLCTVVCRSDGAYRKPPFNGSIFGKRSSSMIGSSSPTSSNGNGNGRTFDSDDMGNVCELAASLIPSRLYLIHSSQLTVGSVQHRSLPQQQQQQLKLTDTAINHKQRYFLKKKQQKKNKKQKIKKEKKRQMKKISLVCIRPLLMIEPLV